MKRLLPILCLWSGLLCAQTVVDDAGQTIVLPHAAQRIVSLAPHLTELIYAVGAEARLVAVSAWSDYPPAAQALPQVSDFAHVDFERLRLVHPDLILAWGSGNQARDIARLRASGLPVYVSESRRLEDISRVLRDLGALTGREAAAAAAADRYLQALAGLRRRYAGSAPLRVFYQVSARPLMTVNGAHLISQALQVCGARNVFAEQPALTSAVSTEAVLLADPDAIIIGGAGDEVQVALDDWRRHAALRAVRADALHAVSADLLHRATPRVLQGIESLCEALRSERDPHRR